MHVFITSDLGNIDADLSLSRDRSKRKDKSCNNEFVARDSRSFFARPYTSAAKCERYSLCPKVETFCANSLRTLPSLPRGSPHSRARPARCGSRRGLMPTSMGGPPTRLRHPEAAPDNDAVLQHVIIVLTPTRGVAALEDQPRRHRSASQPI